MANLSLSGLPDREIAEKTGVPCGTVSRWLRDARISDMIGAELFQQLKSKRFGHAPQLLVCPILDTETGKAVKYFHNGKSGAYYGPDSTRNDGGEKRRSHSLVRWKKDELEAVVFALCLIPADTEARMKRDIVATQLKAIRVQFQMRDTSWRETEEMCRIAKSFARRTMVGVEPSRLKKSLVTSLKAYRLNRQNTTSILAVANALRSLFEYMIVNPDWLYRLFTYDTSANMFTRYVARSIHRSVEVIWKTNADRCYIAREATVEPDGSVSSILERMQSGQRAQRPRNAAVKSPKGKMRANRNPGVMSLELRDKVETCRRDHLELARIRAAGPMIALKSKQMR